MTTPVPNEELRLIQQCLQGRREAWREFIRRYSPLVYYAIQKVLRSGSHDPARDEAADLHNDIFASIMDRQGRKLRQYEGKNGCSVSTWVRVIAVRAAIDHLKKRRDTVPLADATVASEAELAARSADTPLSVLEYREKSQLLKELIDELPARDQLFIRLLYYEGLAPEKIAAMLGSTPNAVYSRGSYLREKLKDSLKKKLSKK